MTVLEMYLWISPKLASERYYTTMQLFNGLSTNIARYIVISLGRPVSITDTPGKEKFSPSPGTISIFHSPTVDSPGVIVLYAQWDFTQ